MIEALVKTALGTEIVIVPNTPPEQLRGLVEAHNVANRARDDLLAGEITPSEYLELAELAGLSIDTYWEEVEEKLHRFGF